MTFSIAGREIGYHKPPYVIAEVSANHNGQIDRAMRTIAEAARCGADAVKLQSYTAETMTIDSDLPDFAIVGGPWDGRRLFELYREAETPFEWHRPLFEFARSIGVTLFSTPFDETAVDLLEALQAPAYKLASFELTDLPLIRRVAAAGKPMIVSTGLASEPEIDEAVATMIGAGCTEYILLHCTSSYPAPLDQANLRRIPELALRYGQAGLSDHTMGTTAAVAAVALGAVVIEKHFTLSRSDGGPDSGFSLEPHELAQLTGQCRDAWIALGRGGSARQPAERENMRFRRSVYFVRDLSAGQVVSAADIRRIRPGFGIEPKHFDSLVGRRLKVGVKRGMPTRWEQFE